MLEVKSFKLSALNVRYLDICLGNGYFLGVAEASEEPLATQENEKQPPEAETSVQK